MNLDDILKKCRQTINNIHQKKTQPNRLRSFKWNAQDAKLESNPSSSQQNLPVNNAEELPLWDDELLDIHVEQVVNQFFRPSSIPLSNHQVCQDVPPSTSKLNVESTANQKLPPTTTATNNQAELESVKNDDNEINARWRISNSSNPASIKSAVNGNKKNVKIKSPISTRTVELRKSFNRDSSRSHSIKTPSDAKLTTNPHNTADTRVQHFRFIGKPKVTLFNFNEAHPNFILKESKNNHETLFPRRVSKKNTIPAKYACYLPSVPIKKPIKKSNSKKTQKSNRRSSENGNKETLNSSVAPIVQQKIRNNTWYQILLDQYSNCLVNDEASKPSKKIHKKKPSKNAPQQLLHPNNKPTVYKSTNQGPITTSIIDCNTKTDQSIDIITKTGQSIDINTKTGQSIDINTKTGQSIDIIDDKLCKIMQFSKHEKDAKNMQSLKIQKLPVFCIRSKCKIQKVAQIDIQPNVSNDILNDNRLNDANRNVLYLQFVHGDGDSVIQNNANANQMHLNNENCQKEILEKITTDRKSNKEESLQNNQTPQSYSNENDQISDKLLNVNADEKEKVQVDLTAAAPQPINQYFAPISISTQSEPNKDLNHGRKTPEMTSTSPGTLHHDETSSTILKNFLQNLENMQLLNDCNMPPSPNSVPIPPVMQYRPELIEKPRKKLKEIKDKNKINAPAKVTRYKSMANVTDDIIKILNNALNANNNEILSNNQKMAEKSIEIQYKESTTQTEAHEIDQAAVATSTTLIDQATAATSTTLIDPNLNSSDINFNDDEQSATLLIDNCINKIFERIRLDDKHKINQKKRCKRMHKSVKNSTNINGRKSLELEAKENVTPRNSNNETLEIPINQNPITDIALNKSPPEALKSSTKQNQSEFLLELSDDKILKDKSNQNKNFTQSSKNNDAESATDCSISRSQYLSSNISSHQNHANVVAVEDLQDDEEEESSSFQNAYKEFQKLEENYKRKHYLKNLLQSMQQNCLENHLKYSKTIQKIHQNDKFNMKNHEHHNDPDVQRAVNQFLKSIQTPKQHKHIDITSHNHKNHKNMHRNHQQSLNFSKTTEKDTSEESDDSFLDTTTDSTLRQYLKLHKNSKQQTPPPLLHKKRSPIINLTEQSSEYSENKHQFHKYLTENSSSSSAATSVLKLNNGHSAAAENHKMHTDLMHLLESLSTDSDTSSLVVNNIHDEIPTKNKNIELSDGEILSLGEI